MGTMIYTKSCLLLATLAVSVSAAQEGSPRAAKPVADLPKAEKAKGCDWKKGKVIQIKGLSRTDYGDTYTVDGIYECERMRRGEKFVRYTRFTPADRSLGQVDVSCMRVRLTPVTKQIEVTIFNDLDRNNFNEDGNALFIGRSNAIYEGKLQDFRESLDWYKLEWSARPDGFCNDIRDFEKTEKPEVVQMDRAKMARPADDFLHRRLIQSSILREPLTPI